MNTKHLQKALAAASVAMLFVAPGAQAALFDRGGGLIYDDVLKVTWLQDANYMKTSGASITGHGNWVGASAWVDGLVYHDAVRGKEWSDWRLPTVRPINGGTFNLYGEFYDGSADIGLNISAPGSKYEGSTASELAYMFYVNLGNEGLCSPAIVCHPAGWGLTEDTLKKGPFLNLAPDFYWTGTSITFASNPNHAFVFLLSYGYQISVDKGSECCGAWALRDGDVGLAPPPVPEPETYALFLAGLGFLTAVSKGRNKAQA